MEVIDNPFSWIARRFNHLENHLIEVRKGFTFSAAIAPEEKPLTRQQAADFLQVTPPTLDEWTKKGLVECRYIASEKRYLPSDLLAALKKPEVSRVKARKTRKG